MDFDEKNAALLSLREDINSTRAERLYIQLKELILSGKLATDTVMPNENELCQMLNVSRSTLRDAYRILAVNGLITRSKTGTYINNRETIVATAPFSIVSELADHDDILSFRMVYEEECARCAAERMTEDELEKLGIIVQRSRSITTYDELMAGDLAFHKSIVECSHNPLLINLFSSVWSAFQSLLSKNYDRLTASYPQKLRDAVDQHYRVYEALCSHDVEGTKLRMREHLQDVYEKYPI